MYKRLVVAVDGSAASDAAVAKAIELASENQSEVRLVNVIDETRVPWEELSLIRRQRELDSLARNSGEVLRCAADRIRQAGRQAGCVQLVRDRRPDRVGDLIAADAKRWGADLIVIGSRGYGPIRRALHGSVDASVMRSAPMPVLPVKATPAAGASRTQPDTLLPTTPPRIGLA